MTLLEHLRPGLRESGEVQAIQRGFQGPTDELWETIRECFDQLDIDKATWGLVYWERAFGIPIEAEKDVAYRRSRVKAKVRGQSTTTAKAIQTVASSFSNGEVEVTEYPAEHRVHIHFVDTIALPPNLEDLKAAIEEILPAHLVTSYVSTLKTWADVAETTWADVAATTWTELRGGTI